MFETAVGMATQNEIFSAFVLELHHCSVMTINDFYLAGSQTAW